MSNSIATTSAQGRQTGPNHSNSAPITSGGINGEQEEDEGDEERIDIDLIRSFAEYVPLS